MKNNYFSSVRYLNDTFLFAGEKEGAVKEAVETSRQDGV